MYSGEDNCLDQQLSQVFYHLNMVDLHQLEELHISGPVRRSLLQKAIEYYRWHLDDLQEVRSHFVLEMVLN